MTMLYDENAPKKATNLSINSDLLMKSRELEINLSAELERVLRARLAAVESEEWKKRNKLAIRAYNDNVEKHGCFGDSLRDF